MKLIKEGEYKSSVCLSCGNKAQWRSNRLHTSLFACDVHKQRIVDAERDERQLQDRINDHMSEADCQTWGRL